MALDLGDLVGRIVLDDKYTDVLDRAEKRTGGFGSTVGKVALGVGVAMAAVGTAAAVGVGALISTGVKYNAQMETYRANLSTLLGSADAAQKQLGELSAFAAATPFEMPQLADASQTLLSFGTSAQDLMPSLKMLGDISLGNSDKLSGLAVVFGQVQSTGHLMGQDLLQFINQGFNPLLEISKMTGQSMESLKDKMAAGGISFDMVRAAMEHATSQGGQFYNAMQNGAMTFEGQVSTLQDGLHILAGSITGDLTDAISGGALPAVNALVGGLVGMANGADGASDQVQSAATDLVSAISGSVGPAIEMMAGQLGRVITAVAPVLGQVAVTLVQSLASIAPGLLSVASTLVLTLINALVAAAPGLVSAAVPILLNLVMGIIAALPALVSAAGQILLALVTGITAALPTLIPAAVSAVVLILTTLIGLLPQLLTAGIGMLDALLQGLLAALPTLIAALPRIIVGIITFLISAIPQLINAGIKLLLGLVGALPQIINGIVAALPQIITALILGLMRFFPQMSMAGIQLLLGLIENLPSIILSLQSAMPKIVAALIREFSKPSVQQEFAQAGVQMMNGLINGIGGMVGKLIDKLKGIAGQAVDTVKGILGIHSPSVVFHGIGVNIGEGLLEGLGAIQPEIDASMVQMVQVPSTSDVTRATMGWTPPPTSGGPQMPTVHIDKIEAHDDEEVARKIRDSQNTALALAGVGAGPVA